MPPRDPATVAANWAQRLGASTQKITDGINSVQTAPGQAAARQKAVWAQNVASAQDKWASRVASVTLSDWQQAAITKGVARIGPGATAAQPKMQAFMTQLLPKVASVVGSLPPRGTTDQNIQRAVAFMQGMAGWTYKPGA